VTGRVKVVRKLSELNKVENGDVLVAKMTTPDYMMAIHKAVAIVTDEGGVTCHAAIVSREFNLPCIVGTKNATQVLSDGDIVEVDADHGIVRVVEDVEVDENIKEIFGKCAFKGKVRGPVRVVFDASDFSKVQEGDILVAPQTTPEYLSTLYKVKGFVVDEDSLTSHAMLYANALKLPSLIGTNFARNVLQDGEMVELDATNGVLKRV
jgi:phosphoenolpyruvate synthase/pyruvate phosphate dikinase